MTEPAPEASEVRRPGLSRAAEIEGYLSLPFVVLTFCNPLLPQIPVAYGLPIGMTLWSCGWLFAISGVRHAKGKARAVAGLSLAILTLHATLALIIALH